VPTNLPSRVVPVNNVVCSKDRALRSSHPDKETIDDLLKRKKLGKETPRGPGKLTTEKSAFFMKKELSQPAENREEGRKELSAMWEGGVEDENEDEERAVEGAVEGAVPEAVPGAVPEAVPGAVPGEEPVKEGV